MLQRAAVPPRTRKKLAGRNWRASGIFQKEEKMIERRVWIGWDVWHCGIELMREPGRLRVVKSAFFSGLVVMMACAAGLLTLPFGSVQASSYIIVDNQTGHILDGEDATEKRQVASLTKIATALVVLDMAELKRLNLADAVAVPGIAMTAGGANPAGLVEGDVLTIRDLLYCALLASDNVAAMTLAHHVGSRLPNPEGLSPVGNFVAHMNALARGLRMKRTLFLNPTGMDPEGDSAEPFSTAADIARLTQYAYSDADFPYYVAQRSRDIRISRAGQDLTLPITNTNELLGQVGIDGVKTGRNSAAGDCLVLSSEQKPEVKREGGTTYVTPRRIMVVLLGSDDRFREGLALTQRGWALYNRWAGEGRKTSARRAL
jgi:D-alanyl-D-alanine carboxypeptidase (penicillin-binding protein 5/6)